MNQIQKIFIQRLIISFFLTTSLFSQNIELITQKINIENAIRDKVNVTINTLLQQSQYVIIVNARMDLKAFSLYDNEENEASKGKGYSAIPGLLPTVPQNIQATTGNTYQYSTEKYLLYGLDIAIYLESLIATGAMQKNIQALVKESIPEIKDCDDCIRFETMNMATSGSASSYKELLKKIEELEADKRNAEQQILNWKFDELEKQLTISDDARTEWENEAKQREKSRQRSDSIRLANLESIEKEYRKKQDSLYLITSIKLDEAVRGQLESNNELQDKLIDIIKTGIDPEVDALRNDGGLNTTTLILIILGTIFISTLIGAIILMISRKPVYLKPKEKAATENNTNPTAVHSSGHAEEAETMSFDPTHANDNSDVARSDLKDLRQSTVALGVSQKGGSNQIVQDWLDTSPDENSSSGDDTTTDEETE
jgi:hypothetical protein